LRYLEERKGDAAKMKRILFATTMILAFWPLAGPANADTATFGDYDLTFSEFAGTQEFGVVHVTGSGTDAHVVLDVSPNWIINTGGPHQPLAFNLVSGTISNVQDSTRFAASGANGASPFGNFTNTIDGVGCNNGGSGNPPGCGFSTLSFDVSGFGGFSSNSYQGNLIYFAADILAISPDCTGSACTGNVGGGIDPVPGPIAGAGLPGLVSACFGMLGFNRWRKRRNLTA
jgi:hypothetical protein